MEAKTVRDIRARDIGKLFCLRGVVTRVSDVRPRVVVATYTCDQCGCEIYQEVYSFLSLSVIYLCSLSI